MSSLDKKAMFKKSIPLIAVIIILCWFFNVFSSNKTSKIIDKKETLEDFIQLQLDKDIQIQKLINERDSLKIVFYKKLAIAMGEEFDIDKALLYGLWMQESSMNPTAKGDGGKAHGLGQVHLTTAKSCFDSSITSVKLMEPITNGKASATYLKQCLIKNKGNIYKGISCYRLGKDSKAMDWEYAAKVLRYASEWRN